MSRRATGGGLLLEVLLALGLVTLTLVVVAGVFPFSYNAERSAWRFATAQRLLASEVESLRSQEFNDLATRVNVHTVDEIPFRLETTVNDFETTSKVKRKIVVCRVIWESKKGVEILSRETILVQLNRL